MTHDSRHTTPDRYSLTELTEAAGVSVRTVRYYIAEGLLPPPVSAGPHSHYTRGHLDRLHLIGRLKAAYLPLREIRRHLTGLDDAEVGRLVAAAPSAAHAVMESAPLDAGDIAFASRAQPPLDSAADYISRVMAQAPRVPGSEADDAWRRPTVGRIAFSAPSTEHRAQSTQHAAPESWRRVPLGDDAELLIREEAYQRKRDRIDWLVRWARKVFG